MRENKLRKLIQLFDESSLEELECQGWRTRIRLRKLPVAATPPPVPAPQELREPVEHAKGASKSETLTAIVSPMVGTFYRAPAPDAKPYVEVGDVVSKGQVVCIVEAMKLFNEIESDQSGKVTSVLIEDAHPVEYGQVLFEVDTSVRA